MMECMANVREFVLFSAMLVRQAIRMLRGQYLLVPLLVLFFAACETLEERPQEVPFGQLYQPINDVEAQRFLQDGLAYLQVQHGPLPYPVNEVRLRYSQKNERGRGYRIAEGFSKTEVVDLAAGHYVVYIAVLPGDPEFFPMLAHEIGHLKEPTLVEDWAMEGFCMVFSEELCRALGYDWTVWREKFKRDSADPYARAYYRHKQGADN